MATTPVYLGIEIGGTKLQLHTGHADGTILHRHRLDVNPQAGAPGIQRQLQSTLPSILSSTPLHRAAVGFGGPVNRLQGTVSQSHQIEGWNGFPLRHWLENLCQCPVQMDNDANMAALGEALAGAGQGNDPVFYVTLGSGVGGGLVSQGRIYHGAPPGESEIGHLRLDREGTLVEQRCSGWAVNDKIRQYAAQHPERLLARLAAHEKEHPARALGPACEQGDLDAFSLLQQIAADLAWALSHVTHLFHPETIVLGGGLSLLGEPWRQAVSQELPKHLMKAFGSGPTIRLATLREDAVPVGCLLAAAQVPA